MTRPIIPHGFHPDPDWSAAEIGCRYCGYHERWEDLQDSSGRAPRHKAVRQAIERDMRALLSTRGCKHVRALRVA